MQSFADVFMCSYFQDNEQGHTADLGLVTALEQDMAEVYFVHHST